MLFLVVRVALSLAVVLGLFWFVARTGSRKLNGGQRGLVRVRGRQSLSRSSSLAVVEVGSRVLVVGVSDDGVRLLTEMAPTELDDTAAPAVEPVETGPRLVEPVETAPRLVEPVETAPRLVEPVETRSFDAVYRAALAETAVPQNHSEVRTPTMTPTPTPVADTGALAGSLLSGSTWRLAWQSATGRANRRPQGRHAA